MVMVWGSNSAQAASNMLINYSQLFIKICVSTQNKWNIMHDNSMAVVKESRLKHKITKPSQLKLKSYAKQE